MVDLKLDVPEVEEVEVATETLAATDRGLADADRGRVVTIEEVRKLIRMKPAVILSAAKNARDS